MRMLNHLLSRMFTCLLLVLLFNFHRVLLTLGNDQLCHNTEKLLSEFPKTVDKSNRCMMSCTMQTWMSLASGNRTMTLLLHATVPGKDNRFCWLRHLLCVKGKRLHKAYVLLPLQEGKLQPDSVIHLQTLGSSRKSLLESEQSQSIFGSECGLRFDMTQFIMVTENLVEICVEPLLNGHPAFSSVMDGLKCQPFLGTIWKKQHHSIQ
ncbi:uncharacterized protein LOC120539179 [Polypterus senegalus]|uniref:uncharacterized protein LOC120539179 n=1 Tax=Polypterus senegalus TaxID=55291 RepID=UPI001966B4EF|nr:uncharacterized protein LOC120539179 [Polypterus senegalus]